MRALSLLACVAACGSPTGKPQFRAGRFVDANRHPLRVTLHVGHHAIDPANGNHAIIFLDGVHLVAKVLLLTFLRPDHHHVKQHHDDRHRDQEPEKRVGILRHRNCRDRVRRKHRYLENERKQLS